VVVQNLAATTIEIEKEWTPSRQEEASKVKE
jgi:hypothetical protein